MPSRSYVLVSACRDEAGYIDGLIDAVAAQTVQPFRWVIVDDGSTDGTYERIVARSRTLGFLEPAKMPAGRPRSFSSKVYAVQHGCELVKGPGFLLIGFLDADVRFGPQYYQKLFERFEADARLGLAGGMVVDQYAHRNDRIRSSSEEFHVPGGVQLFRRECFEQVGGYVPVEVGGEDTIADVMAMMRGWRIRTFPELEVQHLRPEGSGRANVLSRGMRWGRRFYLLGYHPLFYLVHCLRRAGQPPVIAGSLCQLLGFLIASLKAGERPVSDEFVRFLRRMQVQRLGRQAAMLLPRKAAARRAAAGG